MIKVKCRGYEGYLRKLNSYVDCHRSLDGGITETVTYDIELSVSNSVYVILEDVNPSEIEVVTK